MPLYEFFCIECQNEEELLLKVDQRVPCPVCGSQKFEKKWSLFSIKGASQSDSQIQSKNLSSSNHQLSGDIASKSSKTSECSHSSCKQSYVDGLIKKYDKLKGL